jgi:predicted metal-dependent hydrolase
MSRPDFTTHFLRGVEHFNALEFWEAHEAWEEIWLVAQSDVEQFLQGLIQLAAAYHHLRRGTFRGGIRLFEAALRRLSAFPDPWCGIDRGAAVEAAQKHREWAAGVVARSGQESLRAEDYPQLRRVDDAAAPIPPIDQW